MMLADRSNGGLHRQSAGWAERILCRLRSIAKPSFPQGVRFARYRTLESIMVFVLDNYDSFTYNLVQYLGELGAEVVVRRNDQITVAEVEAMHPERILLSPGPCTPGEAGILIPLIRYMSLKAPNRIPILGVCLG